MRFLVVHELGGELGGEAVRAAECGFAAVGRPGGGGDAGMYYTLWLCVRVRLHELGWAIFRIWLCGRRAARRWWGRGDVLHIVALRPC